jgi:predicted short-subunit dehydrogenase-like oxidoreductase (DUF2520 family)
MGQSLQVPEPLGRGDVGSWRVCPSRVDEWDESPRVYASIVGDRRAIGIVGAGRAGMALAVALDGAGWPARVVSSRDPVRRASVAERLPGVVVVATAAEAAEVADLVVLAVPDDAIVAVASGLGARSGSVVAHLSGVHPAEVLRGAVPPGVWVGAFHPLVAFADVGLAVAALAGAYVAVDGDPAAVEALQRVAGAIGARPVVLAPGEDPAMAKAAHHAAAVLAAGGFVALLDAIAELGRVAGLDEGAAIEVYGSLVRQGLANAHALGIDAALTGPVARGDAGTVATHLAVMGSTAPDVLELYRATARRQLAITRERGGLDPERAASLAGILDDEG